MKKLLLSLAVLQSAISVTCAAVFTPIGPATFKVQAIVQNMPFQLVGGKTNQTATSTNIMLSYKGTVAETSFDNAAMLALLANSFNTNFPAGAQMGIRFGALYVVDSTGTNVIFSPGGVLSFQFDTFFSPATETELITQNSSGTHLSGNYSDEIITSATMTYDDTANTTGDGTHTKFAFKGFYTAKINENLKTRVYKANYVFQGTGGGPVRGVQTILTGTITAKAVGGLPLM